MRFPFRYALLAMSGLVLAGTARPTMAQQTITCSSEMTAGCTPARRCPRRRAADQPAQRIAVPARLQLGL
jgi:hypothetical protein